MYGEPPSKNVVQRRFKVRVDEHQLVLTPTITWIIRQHFSRRLCDFLQSETELDPCYHGHCPPPPVLNRRTSTSQLSLFEPVTTDEVRRILRTVPTKHCSLLIWPCTDLVSQEIGWRHYIPVICHLCNTSLSDYCIVLYCIALHCIALHCIVLYCIVLYCIVWFVTEWHV